jgi:hypothetical protein
MKEMLRALGASTLLAVGVFVATVGCGTPEQADVGKGESCPRIVENAGDVIPAPPDGASLCPDGPCNYQTQEGCADDMSCLPTRMTGSTTVQPACIAAGTRTRGDTCDPNNPCERGHFCANGYCRKLCCGQDWSACDEGESCFRSLLLQVDGEIVDSGAWLCFPVDTCDVLTSRACDSQGFDCKMVDPRGKEACIPPSGEQLGEPCSSANACARGLTCVGEPGDTRCRRLCRAEECGEPSCPSSEGYCVHFNRNPPLVGECTPWVFD